MMKRKYVTAEQSDYFSDMASSAEYEHLYILPFLTIANFTHVGVHSYLTASASTMIIYIPSFLALSLNKAIS